jgi:ABC-type uncharacterized transport system ATPase component
MADTISEIVKQSLQVADNQYYKLVLLVGKSGSGKTYVLNDIANELGVPVINVNLKLSERLLELTSKQRALRTSQLLDNIIDTNDSIKVLDNLEILFDTELKQNPFRLLQKISRNHLVIASWNGTSEDGKLIYAEPDHPEYQKYNLENTLVVRMDKTATINFKKIT